tara:strand:+ start:247 stop:459 length:213 start_codon:yes stop_codon:yes gene_type:complete
MEELKKEVESTLQDCIDAIPEYEGSCEGGDYINEGWIEALGYVLNHIDIIENGEREVQNPIFDTYTYKGE